MKISSLNKYQTEPDSDEEYIPEIDHKFRYIVVATGFFPEFDVANRWCWNQFGSSNGVCWQTREYAVCPLTLPTERTEERTIYGQTILCKVYELTPPHHHEGSWEIHWIDKTDYDFGYGMFCFTEEEHHTRFLHQVPLFDWGENYPDAVE